MALFHVPIPYLPASGQVGSELVAVRSQDGKRIPRPVRWENWARWLSEAPTNDELTALLVPFKDEALAMWPVNRQKIGNVRNEDRDVVLPELVS
jgi:putative SOS response-associated peptidase YedK